MNDPSHTRFHKKSLGLILTVLLSLYLIWLTVHLLRFRTYTSTPDPDSIHEVTGAYHIHSAHSDGRKDVAAIAREGARAGLEFVILTDHGRPNLESLASQGWKQGTLVLAGSELSVNRGHLVALGLEEPYPQFSQNAEISAAQIRAARGLSIIAHPYSKVPWSWGPKAGYSGLEIINADSMLRKDFPVTLAFLPALLINPRLTLLKTLDRPEKNLAKWDKMNRDGHVFGFYSTDAHLLYRSLFTLLNLHCLLNDNLAPDFAAAREQIQDALRQGRFFNAVDAAAHSRGFRFTGRRHGETIPMGSAVPWKSKIELIVRTPYAFAHETRLLYNGQPIADSWGDELIVPAEAAGVYRVEVYLRERTPLKRDIPWIISNPIFLVEKTS